MHSKNKIAKPPSYHRLLFGLLLMSVGACMDANQGPQPGSSCEEQSQCECLSCPYRDLLLCKNKTCHRICNIDSDCKDNEYCQEGLCITPDTPCSNKSDCPNDTPCITHECTDNFCQASTQKQGTLCVPESECVINASCDEQGECVGEIQECTMPETSCTDIEDETYVVYYEEGEERDPETCVCNLLEKTTACANCELGVEQRQFCIDCMTASCEDSAGDCQSNCACNPASGECECVPEDSSETNKIPCYLSSDVDSMQGICISGVCSQCLNADDCADNKLCEGNNCVTPVECAGPADCTDDGLFCNGDEYCDDTTNFCAHSGASCGDDEICDEESNVCVECLEDEHCSAPTPSCRPDTNTCVQCWPNDTPCIDLTPEDCRQAQCADGICVQDHTAQSSAPSAWLSCKQLEPCDTSDDCSSLGDDDDDDEIGRVVIDLTATRKTVAWWLRWGLVGLQHILGTCAFIVQTAVADSLLEKVPTTPQDAIKIATGAWLQKRHVPPLRRSRNGR